MAIHIADAEVTGGSGELILHRQADNDNYFMAAWYISSFSQGLYYNIITKILQEVFNSPA